MAKIVSAALVFSAVAVFLVEGNGHHNFGGHQSGFEHVDFLPEGNHGNNKGVHFPVNTPQEEAGGSSSSDGVGENAAGSTHVSNGVSEKQSGKSSGGPGESQTSVVEESSSGHEESGGEEQSSMSFGGGEGGHKSQGEDFGHGGPQVHHNNHGGWNGGYHDRH